MVIMFNLVGYSCSNSNEQIHLERPTISSEKSAEIRVAAPRAALGLIKHLAQNYMDEETGRSVIVEEPLAGKGPQLAHEAGLVDVAIVLGWNRSDNASEFARTELVLALGPGVSDRQLSMSRLSYFVGEGAGKKSLGREVKYLSRSIHDPLTNLFADAYPSLSQSILAAARNVRVPADEDAMAIPRKTAVKRNGVCIALEGNLRMYGIPTWIGRLPTRPSEVSFSAIMSKDHIAAQSFLDYILSSQGPGALVELGFRRVRK